MAKVFANITIFLICCLPFAFILAESFITARAFGSIVIPFNAILGGLVGWYSRRFAVWAINWTGLAEPAGWNR